MALSTTLGFNVRCKEPELIRATAKNHRLNHETKPLSDIDDQEGYRFFNRAMFFYPPLGDEGATFNPVKTIKDGLAKALDAYYPLAGRIFEGSNRKLIVDCNNEGVIFVEAQANLKLDQLGDGILPPCPIAEKLICDVSPFKGIIGGPLLFFQVTKFICGGFSLGILFNHTLVDGYGIMIFLNAIGDLVKGASTPSVQPVWQRKLLNARSPPTITCIHNEYDHTFSYKPLVYPKDTFVLTSVFFSPKEIQALRSQVPTPSTTFDLITACLWKCRTIALEPHPDDMVLVSVAMNLRNVKGANIPIGYYGNAAAHPAAVSKAGSLCASPLEYALDLVRDAKNKMSEEYIKSVADLMVIKGRPKYSDKWNFLVSDARNVGFDELDLGCGKPSFGGVPWATPTFSFYNKIKNNKGEVEIVVPICLPSLALKKFQGELLKMTYGPTSKI